MAQTDRIAGYTGDIAVKIPCRVATTAAITLSGVQTVDGVLLAVGDRVLVKDQASGVENGIYVVQTGAWTRATDFDGARDATKGTQVFVDEGAINAGRFYRVATPGVITPGATSLSFTETPGGVSSATAAAASAAAALASENAAALSEAAAAADAISTAADVVSSAANAAAALASEGAAAASEAAAAASAANLPNAATAGASKYIKSNATADGWGYQSAAAVAEDVIIAVHAAASKTTPVAADEIGIWDTATNSLKKLALSVLKLFVRTNPQVSIATAASVALGENANALLTGTTTVGEFTGIEGTLIHCRAQSAFTLVHSAGLNILQGAANITTAAGDTFDVYMLTSTTCEIRSYVSASGKAVPSNVTATTVTLSQGTINFPATQVPSADPNALDDYQEASYSFTPTATSGSFVSAAGVASHTKKGNDVTISYEIIITDAGTATGDILFTLPYVSLTLSTKYNGVGTAKEVQATGVYGGSSMNSSTQARISKYDGTTFIASGRTVVGTISYLTA